jgi:thioredoxin reductase (NADPH)
VAENDFVWDAISIGGGIAGVSAAIYLGRAMRKTLVIDSGKSMAEWEPDVQNYMGFPEGIAGQDLLRRGRKQAERFKVQFAQDEIVDARKADGVFELRGKARSYRASKVLLATGIFHIPPEINGVTECLGHSMYFCKDCDGYRVQGKAVGIYGWTNQTVEYALGMLSYTATVVIFTDGHESQWDQRHDELVGEYEVPIYSQKIARLKHTGGHIRSLCLADDSEAILDALFTTRGDIYFNAIAKALGAEVDDEGQVLVDDSAATSVPGLYAAGCVTPANCQMIIAAGEGAIAAQAINRALFEDALRTHSLKKVRAHQLASEQTAPVTF